MVGTRYICDMVQMTSSNDGAKWKRISSKNLFENQPQKLEAPHLLPVGCSTMIIVGNNGILDARGRLR